MGDHAVVAEMDQHLNTNQEHGGSNPSDSTTRKVARTAARSGPHASLGKRAGRTRVFRQTRTGSSMAEQRPVKAPDAGSSPAQFATRVPAGTPRR